MFVTRNGSSTLTTVLALIWGLSGVSSLADNPPPPPPNPPNPAAARQEGHNDGHPDGSREGQVRGPSEGARDGQQAGYRAGYDQCEREERQRQYERGLRDGYLQGEAEGDSDGRYQGRIDGEREGTRDGLRDGASRADRDAERDATPPGSAKGTEEANQSDAAVRGFADGLIAGDREAHEKALAVDYPRGKKAYYDERFAEPIESEDEFSQKPSTRLTPSSLIHSMDHAEILAHSANPDYRYYNPRRTYPDPSENQAYQDGYRSGYNTGFNSSYGSSYNSAYQTSYRQYWDRGCYDAKNHEYREDYQRGFAEGKRQGYASAYQRAYNNAYRPAYDQNFRQASDRAYRDTYPVAYDKHFEAARARAYAKRYGEIYDQAFEQARTQKFNEVYPRYAEAEYQRGRTDEAEDFVLRPLRLLSSEVTETIPNGLYEPGEALRVKVKLRNFNETALSGRDIRVQIQALNAGSAVISEGEALLARDLRRKSVTTVKELLEFRLNDSVVNQISRFRVTVFFQGRNVGSQDWNLTAKYMADLSLARAPELSEGLPTQIIFKVKNQSLTQTDQGFKLTLRSDPTAIEVPNPEIPIGILNPGEEREISFTVIARKPSPTIDLVIAAEACLGNGRRVGLFDKTAQVPVMNDYRITVSNSLAGLRKLGTVRAEYVIRNISSRLIFRGLQLKATVKSTHPAEFVILGPSPQYLKPVLKNQTLSFLIPVLVKTENSGGVLELEVQEDGRAVVVHQAQF